MNAVSADKEHLGIPLPAAVTGQALQIWFELTTLYAAVSTAIGPDVMLDLRGDDQPVTIRSADRGDFTTLAMPIKSDHPLNHQQTKKLLATVLQSRALLTPKRVDPQAAATSSLVDSSQNGSTNRQPAPVHDRPRVRPARPERQSHPQSPAQPVGLGSDLHHSN